MLYFYSCLVKNQSQRLCKFFSKRLQRHTCYLSEGAPGATWVRLRFLFNYAIYNMKKIITHPGHAHRDDFLACCVALASTNTEPHIVRTDDIEPEDFEDPDTWIIDVGFRHNPELNNFDHHQLPKDHEACCALTLVLRKLGLYEDAIKALPWVRMLEIWDSKGPMSVSKHLEHEQLPNAANLIKAFLLEHVGTGLLQGKDVQERVKPDTVDGLVDHVAGKLATKLTKKMRDKSRTWDKIIVPTLSPIDTFVLNDFQSLGEIEPAYNIWVMMREIGMNILQSIDNFKTFYNFLLEHGSVREVKGLKVLVSPEETKQLNNVSQIVEAWRAQVAPDAAVSISPDERGAGYSLYRFEDHPSVDFSVIDGLPGVRFTHVNGFIAKTETRDLEKALLLVGLAINSTNK